MKVIDLLNKIANGEEVPKKIKIKQWENNWEDEDLEYELYSRLYEEDFELNDEVEILEEEKKIPEKITMRAGMVGSIDNKLESLDINIMDVEDKINEIIDYLRKQR